jgi:hypothetical protein
MNTMPETLKPHDTDFNAKEARDRFNKTWQKEKELRTQDNLQHLDGFYHGKLHKAQIKHSGIK